jgi:hypothetical protein
MNISDEELVAEFEKRIADGDDLEDLVPVRSVPPPPNTRRSVFSVRLGSDELASIASAARKQGLSIGDFIREAAKRAAAETERQDAGDYSLETFKAEYDALGRKLERRIARDRQKPPETRAS